MDLKRVKIRGKAISVRGNDIDTDRIVPARFLRCVTFDGLGAHAFEDDRAQMREKGKRHPFDRPGFADAEVLLVNQNFGCGSSREHAPQAIMRWEKGIKVIVGESFAEIFFGNCVALGIPCVTGDAQTLQRLMEINESQPETIFEVDLEQARVGCAGESFPISIPEGPRQQFLQGKWDITVELLQARDQIAETVASLPYFHGWK